MPLQSRSALFLNNVSLSIFGSFAIQSRTRLRQDREMRWDAIVHCGSAGRPAFFLVTTKNFKQGLLEGRYLKQSSPLRSLRCPLDGPDASVWEGTTSRVSHCQNSNPSVGFIWGFFFFLNVYLFLREKEKEREHASGGEAERERGRASIQSRFQTRSRPQRAWCVIWTPRPWDHDLSQSWLLNRLSHPSGYFSLENELVFVKNYLKSKDP